MRLALSFLFLALSLSVRGQVLPDSMSGVSYVRYDVDALCPPAEQQGQTLFEWLASVDRKFKGNTSTFLYNIKQYGYSGAPIGERDYFQSSVYQSQYDSSPASSNYSAGTAAGRYYRGIWTFGPSYGRNTIVWFVNGHYRFITHCKARVRRDAYRTGGNGAYAGYIGYYVNDLPQMLEEVSAVEIVTGYKDFRRLIPYLRLWKGKTPALVFVTTKKKVAQ